MIEGLRYKLRMFRVPIDGPSDVFFDNQSVVSNVSIPSYVLNKKHNSICYHRFREGHTAGTIRVGLISGGYIKDDIGTKKKKSYKEMIRVPEFDIYREGFYYYKRIP